MKVPTRAVDPAWFVPGAAALAVGVGALILFAGCPCRIPPTARLALVGIMIVAWLIDLAGIPWPRLAFVVLTTIPTSLYILSGNVELAPLLLCMTVAWV